MTQSNCSNAFLHSPDLDHRRSYMGGLLTIPVSGEHTGGRLAIVEVLGRPGTEPPPHVHEWEDEVFYVLEGRAVFYCGRERFVANPGDCVFVGHGVPHTMTYLTQPVRLLVVFSSADGRPVAMDRYFAALSAPAASLRSADPESAHTYATGDAAAWAARVAAEHGSRFLTPQEARQMMPDYPGQTSS